MKTAWIFPGQGSQTVGMGKDLYDNHKEAKNLFHQASEVLNFDLTKYIWHDCPEFQQTNVVQAALYTISCIVSTLALKHSQPNAVAGHSLGEYSAMVTAQLISFEDGLLLIKARGDAMNEVCQAIDSGMIACLGGSAENAVKLAEAAGCEVANYNTPEQTILSGLNNNLTKAQDLAKDFGFSRCIKLKTAGAYHSSLMKPAADKFTQVLSKINIPNKSSSIPLLTNLTAQPIQDIKQNMIEQIYQPVQWNQTIQNLLHQYKIEQFYEIGHGSVLTNMLSKQNIACESGNTLIK